MQPCARPFPAPQRFADYTVTELIRAAARGVVGVDQRLLHAILDRGPGVAGELARFASEDHRDDPVALDLDLVAMFRHFRAPEALQYYLGLLREDPEDVPDELTEALVELGPAAMEPLLELYRELGEDSGGEVAFVLASLGVREPRILEVLLEQLEYSGSEGAFLLGVYGDPAAKPALEALLGEIPESDKDFRFEVRSSIDGLHEDAVRGESDPFDIWAQYPEREGPTMDALSIEDRLELLGSDAAEYRAEAAASFRAVDLSDESRDRLLQTAKSDPDPEVRASAWESLEGVEDDAVTSAMRQRLLDPEAPLAERSGALLGLSAFNDDPEVRARMIEFYGLPETRAAALKAMWRSLDRTFASYFPKHLDDPQPEIKRQAIWGAGHLGISAEASRLQELFSDDEFRGDALFNYALLAPVRLSRGHAPGLLRKIEDLAEGFSEGELNLVETAIDQRLVMHGMRPAFHQDEEGEEKDEESPSGPATSVGRNDPCPCGSGKKFKKCCGK